MTKTLYEIVTVAEMVQLGKDNMYGGNDSIRNQIQKAAHKALEEYIKWQGKKDLSDSKDFESAIADWRRVRSNAARYERIGNWQ